MKLKKKYSKEELEKLYSEFDWENYPWKEQEEWVLRSSKIAIVQSRKA